MALEKLAFCANGEICEAKDVWEYEISAPGENGESKSSVARLAWHDDKGMWLAEVNRTFYRLNREACDKLAQAYEILTDVLYEEERIDELHPSRLRDIHDAFTRGIM